MKKIMSVSTMVFFFVMVFCIIWNKLSPNPVILAFSITFGTCFYHFAMRLIVGYGIHAVFQNHMNYKRKWFQPKSFEKEFYDKLKVKQWKQWIPSYNPASFDVKEFSIEEIVQVTCQAEIVHEVIMLLSFIPLCFAIWFDEFMVFLITSCLACLFDSVFVILQRYNRPRLMRVLQKKNGGK